MNPSVATARERSTLLWAWTLILVLGVVDWYWARRMGWTFYGWPAVIISMTFLLGVALFYDLTGRNRSLADAGHYAALWIAFALIGAIFTYLTATLGMPLCDTGLSKLDAALGFDWFAWSRWVAAHRPLSIGFEIVYETFVAQIIGSVLFFAHIHRSDRNRELLWTGMVSLIVTAVIAGFIPALGPYVPGAPPVWTAAFVAVRDGTVSRFVIGDLQGVVAMPSFHAVVAILLIYSHRWLARSCYLVLVLNCVMLLSAPSQGHHYLVDIIAGVAVAVLSIAAVRIAMKAGAGLSADATGRGPEADLREPRE